MTIVDFNASLLVIYRTSRKLTRKQDLNNSVHQINLTDIYRTFYPTSAEYAFFSSAQGTFSRTDHMLGYKTSLREF